MPEGCFPVLAVSPQHQGPASPLLPLPWAVLWAPLGYLLDPFFSWLTTLKLSQNIKIGVYVLISSPWDGLRSTSKFLTLTVQLWVNGRTILLCRLGWASSAM